MRSKRGGFLSSAGLVVLLGGWLGLSCGGGFEVVHSTPWSREARTTPEVPREVAAQMEGCTRAWLERGSPAEYPVQLTARVDEEGHVSAAEVKISTLRDGGVEGCLLEALRGASFAPVVQGLRAGGRLSGAAPGPEARALLGNPGVMVAPAGAEAAAAAAEATAATAAAALSPVVITVGAVTILVFVTVYVVAKVIEDLAQLLGSFWLSIENFDKRHMNG